MSWKPQSDIKGGTIDEVVLWWVASYCLLSNEQEKTAAKFNTPGDEPDLIPVEQASIMTVDA